MKKLILTGCILATSASLSIAKPLEKIYEDEYMTGLSANGEWVVGATDDGSIVIRNIPENKFWGYNSNGGSTNYYVGICQPVSDSGVVVGSTTGNDAYYWENGTWTKLKTPNPEFMSNACSITPDGSVICGGAGNDVLSVDSKNIMLLPAVWYRQSDGSYSDAVILPHPELDFTGRVPQYISAVAISEDGKTVAGQIRDYLGLMVQPIIYRCDDGGNWTYELIYPELINPTGVEFPEYPGEFDEGQPSEENYMSEEEFERWLAALQDYYDGKSDEMPIYKDYMTSEEWDEFEAAYREYYARYMVWADKYDAFLNAYALCMEEGFVFVFNNVRLSPDGKYYASSRQKTIFKDQFEYYDIFNPVVMNLEENEVKDFEDAENMVTNYISSDYSLLMAYHDPEYILPNRSYILPELKNEVIPLELWVADYDPDVADWMEDNMIRSVISGINSVGQFTHEDYMCSGVPTGTPDLSTILCGTADQYGTWDEADYMYYSYVFTTGLEPSGVEEVVAGDNTMKIEANGDVTLTGEFSSLSVYNISGTVVNTLTNPSGSIALGLGKGIYIYKAMTADGKEIVKKIAL